REARASGSSRHASAATGPFERARQGSSRSRGRSSFRRLRLSGLLAPLEHRLELGDAVLGGEKSFHYTCALYRIAEGLAEIALFIDGALYEPVVLLVVDARRDGPRKS